MINIKEQQNLFIQIGKKLSKEITAYAIGGTAMMFLGAKESTLDIDLVFLKKEDKNLFKESAKSLGYKEMEAQIIYGARDNCPEMIYLGDARIDLFLLDVIDFKFSETIQKRAEQTHQFYNNLIIKVADPNDILLMKSVTNRAKDKYDIIKLINSSEINWDIIIDEAENQINLGHETAILTLGTRLEDLKNNSKVKIPREVLDKLWR